MRVDPAELYFYNWLIYHHSRAEESYSTRPEVSYAFVHLRSTKARIYRGHIPGLRSHTLGYMHLYQDAPELLEPVSSCLI